MNQLTKAFLWMVERGIFKSEESLNLTMGAVESWLFNKPEGAKYLESKGWESVEEIKKVNMLRVEQELLEEG